MGSTTFTQQQNDFHLKNFYNNIMKNNAMLYRYQFIIEFIGLDDFGITDQTEPSKNISYYAQSATIPGYKLNTGKTTFYGTQFRIPGVLQFTHDWSVDLLIDQNLHMYKGLQDWRRSLTRLELDGGGTKLIPNVQARVSVLSTDHQYCTDSFILEGIWIKSLSQISLQYNANGGQDIAKCKAAFKYQYAYPDPDFNMSGDPLKA